MDQPTGSRISFLQPSGKGKTMGQSLPVDKSFNMARALISGWPPLEIIAVPISQPPEKTSGILGELYLTDEQSSIFDESAKVVGPLCWPAVNKWGGEIHWKCVKDLKGFSLGCSCSGHYSCDV